MIPFSSRLIALLAGLLGAAGIALAAIASHGLPDAALATAAPLLVMHAAAALAVTAFADRAIRPRLWTIAAALLLAGAALFTGDIALRAFTGSRLFAMAAPIGGTTMIIGWLAVAMAAALEGRSK